MGGGGSLPEVAMYEVRKPWDRCLDRLCKPAGFDGYCNALELVDNRGVYAAIAACEKKEMV